VAGRALVLGGGGVTGIAWEFGILAGLAEAGVDLTGADVVVGTSAGSVVGAIICSGESVAHAYERQLAPPTAEKAAKLGLGVVARLAVAMLLGGDARRRRARIGRMALRTKTVPEQERRAIIAARLGDADWPARQRLLVTAVAADNGDEVVFDRDSGVSLVDAVAASCAVPLVWPPVTINGRRYIDGGARTPANVDLAAGCERVVALAPITFAAARDGRPQAQLDALPGGPRTLLVAPDERARRAIGRNVLDPAARAGSARAGRQQAAEIAEAVRQVWLAP
jgi:NTE family protein